MRYSIFLTLALLAGVSNVFSQTTHDYTGKYFWVAFPQNAQTENGSILRLAIDVVGDKGTQVTLEMQGKTKQAVIPDSRYFEFVIDNSFEVRGSDSVSAKAIKVIADRDVSVFAFDTRQQSSDSYAAIPFNELGRDYVVAGYEELRGGDIFFSTQCDVIATQNNTVIHCVAPGTTGESAAAWDVQLKRGEVYQLRKHAGITTTDLTGTRISSNNPVAFLTGHQCAQVPANVSFCNVLVEQEPSIDNLGTEYVAPKLELKDSYTIRVVATRAETKVAINGVEMKSLNAGESFTCDTLQASSLITTSNPAVVCEYIQSHDAGEQKTGDPSMFILSSAQHIIKECSVFVPPTPTGYLSVMKPDSLIESDGLTKRYVRGAMDFGPATPQKPISILNPISGTSKVLSHTTETNAPSALPDAPKAALKPFNAAPHSVSYGYEVVKIDEPADSIPTRILGDERWQHYLTVVTENTSAAIFIDGVQAAQLATQSVPNSNFKVLQFKISGGAHKITSGSPFALYSYGFGMDASNYDAYAHSAGQMMNVVMDR